MRAHRIRSWGIVALVTLVSALLTVAAPVSPVGATGSARAVEPGLNGLIAFDSNRDQPSTSLNEVYVMEPDGSGVTQLTTSPTTYDGGPRWSPDGTRIAFYSTRSGNADVWVMDADGSNPTRLTTDAATDAGAAWSPDGTRLAFTSRRTGSNQIFVMDADGTDQVNLSNTATTIGDVAPAWSPDGTQIAFERAVTGSYHSDVYVMDADGTDQTNLTPSAPALSVSGTPAWSPDGTQIAFASNASGGDWDVWVMSAQDPTAKVNLTQSGLADDEYPAWSPDGGQLVFTSDRDGQGHDLWRMTADGGDPTQLTNNTSPTARDAHPSWQAAPTAITVVQDSVPNNAQDVAYSVTGAGLSGFSLDDDANATLPASRTFAGLAPGTYTVTQGAVAGWSLTGLSCDAGSTDLGLRRASLTLVAGQHVTCTFTDTFRRPDATVATSATATAKGNGVYATSVQASQTATAGVARGATHTFVVQLQNDGGGTEILLAKGASSGSSGYTVKFKVGTTNVTSEVLAGTYSTPPLAPGASVTMKVKVTATTAAAAGSARNVDVTVRSSTITTQRDVVRARATRT